MAPVDEDLRHILSGLPAWSVAVEGEVNVETREGFEPFGLEAPSSHDTDDQSPRLGKGEGIGRPLAYKDSRPRRPRFEKGVGVVGKRVLPVRVAEAKALVGRRMVSPLDVDRLAPPEEREE